MKDLEGMTQEELIEEAIEALDRVNKCFDRIKREEAVKRINGAFKKALDILDGIEERLLKKEEVK
jgi:hypothetical protein